MTDFVNPAEETFCWFASMPPERRLVLRGRRHLPACVAGENASGTCEEVGNIRRSEGGSGEATLSIRTEVANDGTHAQKARVVSTILDPAGKPVGKARYRMRSPSLPTRRAHFRAEDSGGAAAALVARGERNLYKLVTEIRADGTSSIATRLRFGIRTCNFDARKGFFLNGKP